MERLVGWTATLGIAVLVSAPAEVGAAGFSTSTQSATSTAMGGVGAANPYEGNASFYNPALMSEHDGFNAYAGPTFIVPSTSFEPLEGSQISTERSFFPPPNGHLSYTIDDNWSVGIGATFPYGLGIEWEDEWVGRESVQEQSLTTFNINPNVAYSIPNTGLTVAAGGQVVFSDLELRRRVILRDDTEIQTKLGGDGQGFGGTAGLFYRINESFTVGLNYRSAVKVDYDGRAHFENEKGTPFEQQFPDGNVETSITLPHSLALGVGWQIERLYLELDVDFRTWQQYDTVVVDFEKNLPQDEQRIVNNWENAGAVRLGGQYEVIDDLMLRFGGAFDQTPIPDETVAASLPGNDRLIASFGGGYTFSNGFRIDGAYQLVSTIPRDIRNDVAPDGEYQTTAHIVSFNVGYGY